MHSEVRVLVLGRYAGEQTRERRRCVSSGEELKQKGHGTSQMAG